MVIMQKKWNIKKTDIALQKKFSQELNIHPLLAQLLINRNVTMPPDAEKFLACNLSDLHDPFLLKGMDKAIARIKTACAEGEKIVIWGDYDVDGLTAVALLKKVLIELSARVEHYIPHRVEEGYGLNLQAAEKLYKDKTDLIITVDCGINSNREVEFLKAKGIDVIVTDHHQPLNKDLPAAFCIINPLQDGCRYPFKYLAGCGLAFKLSQALTGEDLFQHLDLVALGAVSDIVPMTGENRILVKHGLNQLSKTSKAGLLKLLDKVGLNDKRLTTMHAGFLLGPRLNAAGRVGSAENSLKLLMTDSVREAELLAARLNEDNRLRQQLESKTLAEALAKIDKEINFKEHRVIVLHQDDWHPGVIGIVASRIVERFYRPTILLSSEDEEFVKGSGRSIDNFHLFDALVKCERFLEKFGGHSKACGLSMKRGYVDDFKKAINNRANDVILAEALTPKLDIEAQIPLSLLNEELIGQIQQLSPFGPGNPKPIFTTTAVSLKTNPEIVGKNTVKMWVSDGDITCEAVGFKMADIFFPDDIPSVIDIVYTVALNEWRGTSSIELHLKDMRECHAAVTQPL